MGGMFTKKTTQDSLFAKAMALFFPQTVDGVQRGRRLRE